MASASQWVSGAPFATTQWTYDTWGNVISTTDALDHRHGRNTGLIPRGPDPMSGRGTYIDPITGNQRVLIHTVDQFCGAHCHSNNPAGLRLDINGIVVPLKSPGAHIPIRFE